MSRPTREQIEAARATLALGASFVKPGRGLELSPAGVELLRALLAATAEPTDEELAEEATRDVAREYGFGEDEAASIHAGLERDSADDDSEPMFVARAYVRGARREGAR